MMVSENVPRARNLANLADWFGKTVSNCGFPGRIGAELGYPWGKETSIILYSPSLAGSSSIRFEDRGFFSICPKPPRRHKNPPVLLRPVPRLRKTIPSFVGFVDGLFAQGRQAHQDGRTEFGDLEDGVVFVVMLLALV